MGDVSSFIESSGFNPRSKNVFPEWRRSGSADIREMLHQRVDQALPLTVVKALPTNSQELHKNAVRAFVQLENSGEAIPLLERYCKALESAEFSSVASALSSIKGTEQIIERAKRNYISQVDRFIIGGAEVVKSGHAKVRRFGSATSFSTLKQLETELDGMAEDMHLLQKLVVPQLHQSVPGEVSTQILSLLDRYMFEGDDLERDQSMLTGALIIVNEESGLLAQLRSNDLVGESIKDSMNEVVAFGTGENASMKLPRPTRNGISDKVDLYNDHDHETDNVFYSFGEIPKVVVIDTPSMEAFMGHDREYQELYIDWLRVPRNLRPIVIVYTPDLKPSLFWKSTFSGFMNCSTFDEMHDILALSQKLSKNRQQAIYNPRTLEEGQKDAYDNSDLREWESTTADTYKSLRYILQRISFRNGLLKENIKIKYQNIPRSDALTQVDRGPIPQRKIKTIVDFGTGEGRIAGVLARLGYKVMGLDISNAQLNRSRARIREEGEGLRGVKEAPGLSYRAVQRLVTEGVINKQDLILDDNEVSNNFLTVEGSFFNLHFELNKALIEWEERYPGIDPYEFFNEHPWNEYAFSDHRDMFADVAFDMAFFNWNTFCEVGTPENQKSVLEQIFNVLELGGGAST